MELLEEAKRVLEKSELKPGPKGLLLAVSGGVDSMVMLELLHQSGHAGAVAHFDHGLRGSEGQKELKLVEKACEERGIPFHPVELTPPKKTPEKGIQNWGRETRYEHLYRILSEQRLEGIATAHHADDRLETVLMGFLRGSGYRGVIGVPTERERIIRPLIGISKEGIHRYAKEKGIPYREDPSNRSPDYLRNRIRQELLAVFKEKFPEKEGAWIRSMELLEEAGKILDREGERVRSEILEEDPMKGEFRIRIEDLKKSTSPRFQLFELLRPFGLPPERVREVLDGLDRPPGARWEFGEWELIRDREDLILTPKLVEEEAKWEWRIPDPSDPDDAPLVLSEKEVADEQTIQIPDDPYRAVLDREKLRFPLLLRSVRQGDRFRPFGMKEGSKTVLEHLTDRKWPVHEKKRSLVLCDADGRVLWVPGSLIDDRFRTESSTRKVLELRFTGEKLGSGELDL